MYTYIECGYRRGGGNEGIKLQRRMIRLRIMCARRPRLFVLARGAKEERTEHLKFKFYLIIFEFDFVTPAEEREKVALFFSLPSSPRIPPTFYLTSLGAQYCRDELCSLSGPAHRIARQLCLSLCLAFSRGNEAYDSSFAIQMNSANFAMRARGRYNKIAPPLFFPASARKDSGCGIREISCWSYYELPAADETKPARFSRKCRRALIERRSRI